VAARKSTPSGETTAPQAAPRKARASSKSPASAGGEAGSARAPAAKAAARAKRSAALAPEAREQRIREVAYFIAEARGFCGGDPAEDWIAAEAQVDRDLAAAPRARRAARGAAD